MKKSLWLTLIEKSPRILISVSILVVVCRAQPGDLPKMLDTLTKSDIFCLTGWIVAVVVITVAIAAVTLYVKLKPKKH